MFKKLLFSGCLIVSSLSHALEPLEIAENVYALVGPLENRTPENLGNNATFGFITTSEGVVLIDSGGTLKGAQAIERAIHTITPLPIRLVINTGGQDHRWFGNDYFAKKGAELVTSDATLADQQARTEQQIARMQGLTGASFEGTDPRYAQRIIDARTTFTLGDTTFEVIPVGPSHTGGENMVWLNDQEIAFTGDLVYVDRMLSIGAQSQHKAWISAFNQLDTLKPSVVVPGHGYPTDMNKARQDTLNYLTFLRTEVSKLIEAGDEMSAASSIDQSEFAYLKVHQEVSRRNALRVYEELEWE